MSAEVLEKTVNYCADVLKVSQWSFQGGEVFLEQDLLLNAISLIRKKDKTSYITITTNGTIPFYSKELLKSILHDNIGLRVSIDNFPRINDQSRGKSRQVLDFLFKCLAIGIKPQICITPTPKNISGMSKWVRYLVNIGIDWFVIFPVVEAGWDLESIKEYWKEKDEVDRICKIYNINQLRNDKQTAFCGRYNEQIWIDIVGNFFPCHMAYFHKKEVEKIIKQEPRIGSVWEGIDFSKVVLYNTWEMSNRYTCIRCKEYNNCRMCWIADTLGNKVCPSSTACRLNKRPDKND